MIGGEVSSRYGFVERGLRAATEAAERSARHLDVRPWHGWPTASSSHCAFQVAEEVCLAPDHAHSRSTSLSSRDTAVVNGRVWPAGWRRSFDATLVASGDRPKGLDTVALLPGRDEWYCRNSIWRRRRTKPGPDAGRCGLTPADSIPQRYRPGDADITARRRRSRSEPDAAAARRATQALARICDRIPAATVADVVAGLSGASPARRSAWQKVTPRRLRRRRRRPSRRRRQAYAAWSRREGDEIDASIVSTACRERWPARLCDAPFPALADALPSAPASASTTTTPTSPGDIATGGSSAVVQGTAPALAEAVADCGKASRSSSTFDARYNASDDGAWCRRRLRCARIRASASGAPCFELNSASSEQRFLDRADGAAPGLRFRELSCTPRRSFGSGSLDSLAVRAGRVQPRARDQTRACPVSTCPDRNRSDFSTRYSPSVKPCSRRVSSSERRNFLWFRDTVDDPFPTS